MFLNFLPVLSPKQVSSMEHVLPIKFTSWTSKNVNSLHKQVRLGMRVSSFDSKEKWVVKFGLSPFPFRIQIYSLWIFASCFQNCVEFFLVPLRKCQSKFVTAIYGCIWYIVILHFIFRHFGIIYPDIDIMPIKLSHLVLQIKYFHIKDSIGVL